MKRITIVSAGMAVTFVVMSCEAAILGQKVDSTQWQTQDLSERTPSVTFGAADQDVTVQFYSRGSGIPSPVAAALSVNTPEVVGDYSGVEGLSIRISRSGALLADVRLVLQGASGVTWSQRLTEQLSSHDGERCAVNVPLIPAAWRFGGRPADYNSKYLACWNQDIKSVSSLKLVVTQIGFDPDIVSIADVRLVGEGFISNPVTLEEVNEHFAVNVSNSDELSGEQRAQDSDRDGRTDLAQMLNGDDPGLYVEIIGVDQAGRARLRWQGVQGRRYRLERSDDLTAPEAFEPVAIDDPVADRPGAMERTDNTAVTGSGPYFYRAVKE